MVKRKFEDEMSNANQDDKNASSSYHFVGDSIESDFDHDSIFKMSKEQ